MRVRGINLQWLSAASLGLLLGFTAEHAPARETNVDKWVAGPLAAYVVEQLTQHPRFRDAPVRFVVMSGNQPAASTNALALRLRDRLQREVAGGTGVTVLTGAPQANAPAAGRGALECQYRAQYLIGLELRITSGAEARAELRAVDTVEQSFVAGFSKRWSGKLSGSQRRQFATASLDRSFVGGRSVPYVASETDLMAAHLGRELRCALMRNVVGEYRVRRAAAPDETAELGSLAELVANHLSGTSTLRWVEDAAEANAALAGKAHRVDDELHQYWVTLTPTAGGDELTPISASVYVHLPTAYMSAQPAPPREWRASAVPTGSLFESVSLVRLDPGQDCGRQAGTVRLSRYRTAACWGLNIRTHADAVVFVLKHQQNHGLVRLSEAGCRARTAARIARANENTTVRIPADWLRDEWAVERRWQIDPDADTYYAIAVSNSRAARELASHLDELPQRCSASVRPGYEGETLAAWLSELSASFGEWQPHVDWNAIKIKNVY